MTSDAFAGDGDGPLQLHCIGVRFADVPAAVRDALALSPSQVGEALAAIGVVLPGAEAVVLATCNRTELYVVEAGDPTRLDIWHQTVGHRLEDAGECPAVAAERFHLVGAAAVEHLLRVVTGLDSAELGDYEIAGQVRRARELAVEAGVVGPVLHRLFDVAAGAGRRARTETDISAGGAGVGRATARAVVASGRTDPAVTVIGAGDAAHAVCRELAKRTGASLTVVNRTEQRARELAARFDGRATSLDHLAPALATADVVVTAVHGEGPIIDAELVDDVRGHSPGWNPLVIDTCVPPQVAPDVGLEVVHIDELAAREAVVLAQRADAIPAVEAIIADTAAGFGRWVRDRALRDVIAALYREADSVTAEAAGLVDDDRVARHIHRAVRRLVHEHITRLRDLDGPVDAITGKDLQP